MGLFDNVVPGGKLAKPVGVALLALLAYRALQGNRNARAAGTSSADGMLDSIFGESNPGGSGAGMPSAPDREQIQSVLPQGLNDLIARFRQGGLGGIVESWIGTGANRPVEPSQLDQALSPQEVDALARRLGMSRQEVLDRLTRELPETVDRLTPDGQIPRRADLSRL